MRLISYLSATCLLVALTTNALSGNACDKVIDEGIFREENLIDNSDFKREVLDLACNSSESIATKSKEIGLRIPLPKIIVGGNYNSGTGSINRASACSDKSARSSEQIATNIRRKYADPDLLKAWLSCTEIVINSENSGLLCRIKSEETDPEQVTVTVNWKPTTATQSINLNASTRNLHCEGFVKDGVNMNAFESRIFLCSRTNIAKSSSIAVNSNASGSRCDLKVDAIVQPTEDDLVQKCFQSLESQYPNGVAGNMVAAAKMRACEQAQISRTDLVISKLAESQWKRCVDMFDADKVEIAKSCVEANTMPGFKIENNWRAVAERGYNEAVFRRTQAEEFVRSARNRRTKE